MIFEYYQRSLKTGQIPDGINVATHGNTFKVVDGKVVLGRTVTEQFIERNRAHIILPNPIPSPFGIITIPSQFLEPDGSYVYTPSVVGGVAPYSFEIEGDISNGNFQFDPLTGTLSRPPQ